MISNLTAVSCSTTSDQYLTNLDLVSKVQVTTL